MKDAKNAGKPRGFALIGRWSKWTVLEALVSVLAIDLAGAAGVPGAPVGVADTAKVKYRSTGDVNFEDMLVRGQTKRKDAMVETGDAGDANLLKLREHFLDHLAGDLGERQ